MFRILGRFFFILGCVLDSGTCFWILRSVSDSGTFIWILGCVLDSGKCFGPTSHRSTLSVILISVPWIKYCPLSPASKINLSTQPLTAVIVKMELKFMYL